MPSASTNVLRNSETELVDDMRLIGDLGDLDADRKLGRDRLDRLLEVFAEREDVAAVLHRDAETERRLATLAHDKARRVLIAAPDRRDVAEPEHPAVRLHRHGGDRVRAGESASHPHVDAVGGGVDRSARHDRILPRHAVEDLLRRDAERGELGVAEFDEDFFRPHADEIDLVDRRDAQQALADVFPELLELREAHAVGGEHVERRIDIAEFVVEVWSDNAGGKISAYVGDLLARLVPQLLDAARRRRVRKIDLDEGDARLRIAGHAVEIGQLLQLLLDLVDNLGLQLGGGRARPGDLDGHDLDRERWVLSAAELEIGEQAGGADQQDHEQHQRLVRDGPFRQIEALHGAAPRDSRR